MNINVFVLASLPGALARVKSYLRGKKNIVVSSFSTNPGDAFRHISANPYHLLLIDDSFFNSAEMFRILEQLRLLYASERTIIYTGNDDAQYITKLIKLGITAIVHKTSERSSLLDAIKLVSIKASYIDSYFNFKLYKNHFTVTPVHSSGGLKDQQERPVTTA